MDQFIEVSSGLFVNIKNICSIKLKKTEAYNHETKRMSVCNNYTLSYISNRRLEQFEINEFSPLYSNISLLLSNRMFK